MCMEEPLQKYICNVKFIIKHMLTKNREAQSHAPSHLNQLLEPIAKDAAGNTLKPPLIP